MIDISNVQVGDKVRISNANGDEATFTVTRVYRTFIGSENNEFSRDSWDTLEILERDWKLIPGFYHNLATGSRAAVFSDGRAYYTSAEGAWVKANPNQPGTEAYRAVRLEGVWRREVTF